MIDLHCHLLPGVDDGASSIEETRAAIEQMVGQGVRGIVVTPHVSSSNLLRPGRDGSQVASIDEAWERFRDVGAGFADLSLHRGSELMLDQPGPDLSMPWVRLGGTRFVLVEFPGMMIPPRAADALATIVESGYVPVIAHPERYRNAGGECEEAIEWRTAGARLQVNCGSVIGRYGADALKRARHLLAASRVDYLASDYHARGPYPLDECVQALEKDASEQIELLLSTNPARLLEGLDPLEVPPIPEPVSRWKSVVGMRRLMGLS